MANGNPRRYTMIKFTAEYKDKTYTFDFGYEAYIFHIALCNEFVDKYNEAELLNFISLVSQCYLAALLRLFIALTCLYVKT